MGLCWLALAFAHVAAGSQSRTVIGTDVCVYGGTASGVMAAVAASREGCRVVLVEPGRWLGGMTGGGISHIDWGNEAAVGGTTLKILRNDYNNAQYRQVFRDLCEKHDIRVLYELRLNRVLKKKNTIREIVLDYAPPDEWGCPIPGPQKADSLTIRARVFLDCSYEGDLMAKSGVSYTFGRESKDQYGESLAGVEPNLTVYDIDPYVVPGNPDSGLLPFVQDRKIAPIGSADRLIMGYCFRYKFDMTGGGIPIPEPKKYDPAQFELFRRGFQKGLDLSRARYMKRRGKMSEKKGYFISPSGSGNTNRSLLTTTIWGCNTEYPDGDWETRSKIWKFHQEYFIALIHFLRTDPSVPAPLKAVVEKLTFARGIFDDTQGWPHQLYVREARRMISSYVLTQKDVEGKTDPPNPIGLASYGVDEWPYAIIAVEGKVAISGGMYSEMVLNQKNHGIYKIPYQAIAPKAEECNNLLVPVCLSASHIAMTSIRMEPVWMILGESAGVAAAMAAKQGIAVQKVDYTQLRAKLLALGQKLEVPGRKENEDSEARNSAEWVELNNSGIQLQIDRKMQVRVFYKKEGRRLTITCYGQKKEAAFPVSYVVANGKEVRNFALDFGSIREKKVQTNLGSGSRVRLHAVATGADAPPLEMRLTIELYRDFPNTAITYAAFRNLSASQDIQLDTVYSNCFLLDASLIDSDLSPHAFYSFYGTAGRPTRQIEKILPANFHVENFTGRPFALEGIKKGNGGIPVVDLWSKAMGMGIGHIEPKWKNLYLPIRVRRDGRVFMAIKEIPNIFQAEPFILQPGETYRTVTSFVHVHSMDFYNTIAAFSELMRRQGVDMHTKATLNDYLPAWCSWNEYSTAARASKKDVMLIQPILRRLPQLQALGVKEIIFDAGWFNNQGDWLPNPDARAFPEGEADLIAAIEKIHRAGFKVKLWVSFLTADPWSKVAELHPEWMIRKPDGSFHLDRWSGYTMCPSLPEVQEYHRNLARRLVAQYGADGFKVDGMYVCPPCYNPDHHHRNPNESSEDYHKVFASFFNEAKSLNPQATIMVCPCGTISDYLSLPYVTETIAADPKSYEAVRRKAKLYRALKGPTTPYSSDYIDIEKGNLKFPTTFATAIGTGAVPQAFFGKLPSNEALEIYKKWLTIYGREMVSRAEYLNLYDMHFDRPETHVFRKTADGRRVFYFSFYADDAEWDGEVEFRGLEKDKVYVVYDYVHDQVLGTISGRSPRMHVAFRDYLLVKCQENSK